MRKPILWAVPLLLVIVGSAWARLFLGGVSTPVVVPVGPVAEWVLNSASITGATVADASGNGHTASVVGGPLTFGPMGATFNGSSQYLDNATVHPTGWSAITVAGWVNLSSIPSSTYPHILGNAIVTSSQGGIQFFLFPGAGMIQISVGTGTSIGSVSYAQQFNVGSLVFCVATYDGATIRLYLNAVQVASTPFIGLVGAGSADINVGRDPQNGSDFLPGLIYDVRVYNRAIAAAEIISLYNAVTPPQSIAAITLSSNTFTSGTANGVVGAVNVTMNPTTPASTATLAISGTNSGGLHLSGTSPGSNLLQSSSGTPAGTYNDFTIVATQASASLSPFSSSPSITGTAGGATACDIGPPYVGVIPAAATQAGFTHCAANYDFTQTGSFTDSLGTHQWSNLSSWLVCNTASTNQNYLFYFNGNTGCDINHQNVTSDGGNQVLALTFYLTDHQAGDDSNSLWSGQFVGPPPGNVGTGFPEQYYFEHVLRPSTATPCSGSGCIWYYAQTWAISAAQHPCFVEGDPDEMYSYGTTANVGYALWNAPCPGTSNYTFGAFNISPPAPVSSGYQTYGYLQTMDSNAENMALCAYYASGAVNGLPASDFVGCNSASIASTVGGFTTRTALHMNAGPNSTGQGSNNWTAASETTYFERETLWVCPNPTGGTWQTTGNCNNGLVTTHP